MLIDLKKNSVQHIDIGQMNMYMGYFAKEENMADDNPPIGIILSHNKDELLVEYATYGMDSNLFVSKYEGFGIPILEAMACNCRLIVSNVASIPEVCGDNGLYIDPYDVNTFSEAMNKIDDFEIDKNKRLHQIEKFSNWEKSANTLIDALLGDKLE